MASSVTWTECLSWGLLGLIGWMLLTGRLVPKYQYEKLREGVETYKSPAEQLRDRLEFERLKRQIRELGLLYDEHEPSTET